MYIIHIHIFIKLRSHIATLLQNRSNFAAKITTNKIARCEHHGKICSKKHSRAKSLQNRSKINSKHVCYMCKILSKRKDFSIIIDKQ